MRKDLQPKVRATRKQLAHHLQALQDAPQRGQQQEREQLGVLADYALAIQTALNFDGTSPFGYAGIQGYDGLTDIESSLQSLQKRGLLSAEPYG